MDDGTRMTAEINQLMGEIIENPEGQKKDIEGLLVGFLEALVREQKPNKSSQAKAEELK
ncbi:MAG: hypothetical protein HYX41_05415 [Bdellovibrio sp.]|nr:hypothetical protein [Bdellovibrio sp.]